LVGRTLSPFARSCLRNTFLWLLLLFACLALLGVSGAFRAEFGEYPDEPSHFVTSLMVRDYVAGGAASPPMRYALDYYLHFPKVALGHYPPLLYVIQAAWMLVLPASKASLLVLNAILIALTGVLMYGAVQREFGRWAGAGVAFLWVGLPLVQTFGGMVMAEALAALLLFGAAVCYGRYLDNPRLRNAAAFGLLAALAILTKQLAVLLALVPLIAAPLARRARLATRTSFWVPALLVAGLAGPWYVFVHLRLLSSGIGALSGRTLDPVTVSSQAGFLVGSFGYALIALATLGFWSRIVWPAVRGRPVPGSWAAQAACLVAFAIIRFPLPAAGVEARYLFTIQPTMLLFAAAGVALLAERLSGYVLDRAKWAWVLSLAVGLSLALWTFRIPHRRYHGYSEAAALVLEDPEMRDNVSLICADASGEGAFVAAVAEGGSRSGHIVLRANKVLASTNWNGTSYQARFTTPEDLQRYMESVPVRTLAVQPGPGPPGHLHWGLVRDMLREYPDRWTLIGSFPKLRPPSEPGAGVEVYRLNGQEGKPRVRLSIRLQNLQGQVAGK